MTAATTLQAGARGPAARTTRLSWRLLLAAVCIVLAGASALWLALQEPSLGMRFEPGAGGAVNAVALGDQPPLDGVRRLEGADAAVDLGPTLLVESAGVLNLYADQDRFYAAHQQVWQLLRAPEVRIVHAAGTTAVQPRAKTLGELGARFWVPWLAGLLALAVGLGVWAFSPPRGDVRCYLVAGAAYAFTMMNLAATGSRLLTQPPAHWQDLLMATHTASFLLNGGLALLLWGHPNRLGGRWFGIALTAWSLAWLAVDYGGLVDTIAIGFRLPATLAGPVIMLLFGLQWRASRADPVKRAQIKWLFLLFAVALSGVFASYVFTVGGQPMQFRQAYVMSLVALLFVGLLPLVTRLGLFQLEAWWASAWLWFLGGLLVVAMDLLLVATLHVGTESALALALALGGWLYFPIRQALWNRLSRGARPAPSEVLPEVVALISLGNATPARLRQAWIDLWDKVFRPQRCEVDADPGGATAIGRQGRELRIGAASGLPALRLTLAQRGARLFNAADVRSAEEIRALVQRGLATQEAVEATVRAERQRIAADLHDDLGARLLSIAHGGGAPMEGDRARDLARQALEDMRLAVRGLSGVPMPLDELVADWRAETLSRLAAAGIRCDWRTSGIDAATQLPPGLHTHLTRVLREGVSNAIRHSGASSCTVSIMVEDGTMTLAVEDDGRGLAGASRRRDGHGLPGIQRRMVKLGGTLTTTTPEHGGTRLEVTVPLLFGGAAGGSQGPEAP